ncbi:MAG: FAD-dependent oxidoreductase [Candidatus Aenigmarchaeota archaeon]|nr:FAD-dependent oxidoreductase [Candidatus Aenigmarchaeota archaeon]
MTELYDIIVLGGGAAGLTAAIYTCRKKLKTLLITVDVGGQTLLTNHIENYPGYYTDTPGYPSGPKLMQTFEEQAKLFGAELIFGKANRLEKTEKGFRVSLTNGEQYECRAIILAYGKVPRSLGIPGEDKFIGRGVSTCATCDAPIMKNKITAVVGGGNSAIEAAELLTKFSSKVYIIHRRDAFRADEITLDKVKANPKAEFVLNSVLTEIKGDKFVKAAVVEDVNTKAKREIELNGVFVEIGYIIETDFVKEFVTVNASNEIVVNEHCETGYPGIFAAGDLTNVPFKQTVISAGQGATAGLSAYNYLMKLEGKTGAKVDWG